MSKDAVLESLRERLKNTSYYGGTVQGGGYVSRASEIKEQLQEKLNKERNAGEYERKKEIYQLSRQIEELRELISENAEAEIKVERYKKQLEDVIKKFEEVTNNEV